MIRRRFLAMLAALPLVNRLPIFRRSRTTTFTAQGFTGGSVRWTSSNPEVASVDQNGVVTAHKPGSFALYEDRNS